MRPEDLDLDALRVLAAVVDAGGFTSAARGLHATQAAVSSRVAGLERAVGARLLVRSRRGARPTPEGETLLDYARRLLALRREAALALAGPPEAGKVGLGLPDECLAALATPLLARLAAERPGLAVELRCDLSVRLEADLAAGELDLAVIVREPGEARGEPLRREKTVWCAAGGVFPERSRPLPLALFSDGCRTRRGVLAALSLAGIPWRMAAGSSHLAGIVAVVGAGLALTALMRGAVPRDWRIIGPADGLPELPDYVTALLIPPDASPAARLVADMLRRGLAD